MSQKQPLVEPDVLIKQKVQKMKCAHLTPFSDPPPPQWSYTTSTPLLESRGVTDEKLSIMVDNLNNYASDYFKSLFDPKLTWIMIIPCTGVTIGIILLIIALDQFIVITKLSLFRIALGPAIIILSMFLMLIFIYVIYKKYGKAQLKTCEKIAEYVENTMNPKVEATQGLHMLITKKNAKDDIGFVTYYHIGIKVLNSITHYNDGQEHVMYLGLDGRPVNRLNTFH